MCTETNSSRKRLCKIRDTIQPNWLLFSVNEFLAASKRFTYFSYPIYRCRSRSSRWQCKSSAAGTAWEFSPQIAFLVTLSSNWGTDIIIGGADQVNMEVRVWNESSRNMFFMVVALWDLARWSSPIPFVSSSISSLSSLSHAWNMPNDSLTTILDLFIREKWVIDFCEANLFLQFYLIRCVPDQFCKYNAEVSPTEAIYKFRLWHRNRITVYFLSAQSK